jgi:hypothetical protein
MKYWEIVADKLSARPAGRGDIAAPIPETAGIGLLTPSRRSPLHHHSDEPLSAFLELEATLR